MIDSGPIPAVHGVVRWRIIDLCQWLWEEFEVSVSKQTLGRELRAMGYRKLSASPRHRPHPQADGAVENALTYRSLGNYSATAFARARCIGCLPIVSIRQPIVASVAR